MSDPTIIAYKFAISAKDRATRNGHPSLVIWLTGLSGSGKSTLADRTSVLLWEAGISHYILDGDTTRMGLCQGLGFSRADRTENIRRVAEAARLLQDAGHVVLVCLISPAAEDRAMAKNIIGGSTFHEIHVDCPLQECKARDPKGLYARAIAGEIQEFTGIHSPYERPEDAALVLSTDRLSIEEAAQALFGYILQQLEVNQHAGNEGH